MNAAWDHRQHASRTHGTHESRSRTGRIVARLRTLLLTRHCIACGAPDPDADGFCTEACRQDWADSIAY